MAWLEEWFVQRRGLAFGVMWSGTGTGGIAIPLVLESLLQKYGFRTTLRIWAVSLLVLSTPAFFFVKPRIPASSIGSGRLRINLGFVYDRTFVLYQAANIVESLGYFLPTIYLPHYARSVLKASPFLAAFTVLLINVSNAAGIFLMGILADRWHITTCILVSTIGAVLATFFLWGFAGQLAILYVFCVVYGLFAGSYVGTWPGVSRQVVTNRIGHESSTSGRSFDPTMVTGFLIAGRGIGNIISGPLSEALLKASTTQGQSAKTWGLGGYGAVIVFTGVTALGGGSSYVWKKLGWLL
ncbi:hypothetical protein NW762_012595 [Fusarium torreyae]|uniref:Major facilitator superfamily (MFS) profile domain-containing protein n=1 Tax=Fusarium torreyae TaxID=1237075 RepID=A0A9W8RQW1_9HYPO|nr:hypothetical protein NW762_012595 [Fusarium torreyae]